LKLLEQVDKYFITPISWSDQRNFEKDCEDLFSYVWVLNVKPSFKIALYEMAKDLDRQAILNLMKTSDLEEF
jgi:hypothetical protein